MRKRIGVWLVVLGWLGVVGIAADDGEVRSEYAGVVVEEVGEGSALEKAGLRPGDVVYSWRRLANPPANLEAVSGEIVSPFDWLWFDIEQAPRGTVELVGARDGEVKVFEVLPGKWKATVRARMPGGMLEDYVRGKELIEAEDLEAGIDLWYKVTEDQEPDGLLRCWLLLRIGGAWGKAKQWDKAHGAYRSALEAAQGPRSRVAVWRGVGDAYETANEFELAREAYGSAQEIRKRIWGESLAFARGLRDLGRLDYWQGRIDSAQRYWQRELEIQQKLAPGSLGVAGSLNSLGNLAADRGDLDRATKYYEGSLAIRQMLAPNSLDVASSLNNLGILASDRNDWARAAEYYEGALEIYQMLAPNSLGLASSLNNLGILAMDRGDLVRAAEYCERALEIQQKLAPGSLYVAASLNNFGILAADHGDLDRATEYHEQSMEIEQKVAPGSLRVAASLNNLGILEAFRGEYDRAVEYYEEALEIRQKFAPGSLYVATSLCNLGFCALQRGDLNRAVEYYESALEITRKVAPGSLGVASSLYFLGRLASKRGNLGRAAEYYEETLEIQQQVVPGSSAEAATLYVLAELRRKQSQPQLALALFRQTLQSLENQVRRLGRSRDVQADFRAHWAYYYRATIDLALELHQVEEAFHTLERSRAQSFLAQLAERDLVFSDVPEELERQRRRIVHGYDQTQAEIARLNPRDQPEEIENLLTRLHQLRRDYEDITEEIIKVSPKLGALRYPKSLALNAARQALDPGTVMLSYSVGENETHLFILTRDDGLEVKNLPLGEEELREEVKRILDLQKRRSSPHLYTNPMRQVGEHLYQALIQPAEESIAKSERVLIIPDGPLHLLPFALLVRKTDSGEGHEGRDFEYLVEWKPLHSALSATVYAELKSQRSQPAKATDVLALAAFGDPLNPFEESGDDLAADRSIDVYVRAAVERGFDNSPLPYSREEVSRITALYPEGTARAFLGAEASEEQAKSVGKSARILHFATHGRYDDRFPLNSYLALTIPKEFRKGQDNGLLQAWEIFESVRLDADLVVLSACESGLGDEIDGEGLKGLTRAFQFAGARTVASSLWQVEDRATAELMVRFYRHLRAGMTKDEALRAAQMELIRGPIEVTDADGKKIMIDASAPYFWAAFQLLGDWQ